MLFFVVETFNAVSYYGSSKPWDCPWRHYLTQNKNCDKSAPKEKYHRGNKLMATIFGSRDILAFHCSILFPECYYRSAVLKSGSFGDQVYSTRSLGEGSRRAYVRCLTPSHYASAQARDQPTPPRGNPVGHSTWKNYAKGLYSPPP